MPRVYLWKTKETKELFQAMLSLKTVEEAEKFFRDLCTREEIDAMARRWQAAQQLANNEPYREVAEETGLSTATVTRVSHWLTDGMGGYQLILRRLGLLK